MNGKANPMETERLILREIREKDASLIVGWRSNPEIYQYFALPEAITEKDHLRWYQQDYAKNGDRIDFIAMEKVSMDRIGVFSIKRDGGNPCRCEMGYLLDEKMQKKGYAQEAVKRVMLFAEEVWRCTEAVCSIHENNKASQKLAYRLGFKEVSKKNPFIMYHVSIDRKYFTGGYWKPRIIFNTSGAWFRQVAA